MPVGMPPSNRRALLRRVFFLLASFNLCTARDEICDTMTDKEFYGVFRNERGQVPLHEFVKLDSLPDTKLKQRLSTGDRILSFTAFDRHYHLQLKLRDNVLLGKNTRIWRADSNSGNSSDIKYTLLSNVLNSINGIYQDSDNLVSLLECKYKDDGKVFYNGVISADLAISPLPRRVIDLLTNKTGAGDVSDHVVFKVSSGSPAPNYSKFDITNVGVNNVDRPPRAQQSRTLYLEILVVVDASLYRYFGKEPLLAMNYLIPFWNGVDLRYRLLRAPEIKINIAGVILAQDEAALRFVHDNLDTGGRIEAKRALIDAGEYFSKEGDFASPKDLIVTMTKRDICSTKHAGYCKSSALGKAFTGKACSRKKNTAIFEDNGAYTGIITATHEIGHLLGLPHDGEAEASNCSIKDGYIMASAKFRSANSFCWSTCSKKLLEELASSTIFDCLENKPENLEGIVEQALPGKILTLEEQCLARGGRPCLTNATVCWKLHCTKSMTSTKCVGKAPAAEGSTCGDGLYCINGRCVSEEDGPAFKSKF